MKLQPWALAPLVLLSFAAVAQAPLGVAAVGAVGAIPGEEDCLAFIAVLPTFRSAPMLAYYEAHPNATGKELVAQIQTLAQAGDKEIQFTYGMLLGNGYCVPKDLCSARRYLALSRGGATNWEQTYPMPPWATAPAPHCQ